MDYGVPSRPPLRLHSGVAFGGAAVMLAFSAWLLGGAYLKHRDDALALAQRFTIDGPSCPSLSRNEFLARGLKAPKGLIYEDAVFYRRFGHMECGAIRYGRGWSPAVYPVCQFTSPGALRVTTPKGDWYFEAPPGQPATLSTPHGRARCVMASNFTLRPPGGR